MRVAGDDVRGAGGGAASGGRAGLAGAVALGLVAYAALAWSTRGDGVRVGWLLGAQAAGWAGLWWAWRVLEGGEIDVGAKVWILVGAVGFRLCGVGATPAWEDDYFRYLWDGWMTWHRGSPYGTPPLDWFASGAVPGAMQAVLDGVNNPERATIYGPVAQAWFAVAAALGEGRFWVLKAALLVAEAAGLWALTRWAGWKALLIAGWCPLAVTEIAFAGHADALCMAAVAGAALARARGRGGWAAAGLAAGCAVKAYAVLLAPFFLWRGSWRESGRAVAIWGGVLAVIYAPWVWMTRGVLEGGWSGGAAAVLGLESAGAMAGGFEFNSTGFAVLAWWLGDAAGRMVAGAALAGCVALVVIKWIRSGVRACGVPPGEEWVVAAPWVVAAWAWWSPVFHPWYALLALPFWARRPTAWGMALLAALPLSYVHGLTLAAGAAGGGDFRHPPWVRPVEAGLVGAVAFVAWWRARVARGDRRVG